MSFVRKKTIKGHDYYYKVESIREGDKVRQKVIEYLGTTPPIKKIKEKPKEKKQELGTTLEKKTESGKNPDDIKVKIELSGDTFPKKDQIKSDGYMFDGNTKTWYKDVTLSEADNIIKEGVLNGYIELKKINPNIKPIDKIDDKDVYFWNKKYISDIWTEPSKTIKKEIVSRGLEIYPFLNIKDYIFKNDMVFVKKKDCKRFSEKIKKEKKENPNKKYPKCES